MIQAKTYNYFAKYNNYPFWNAYVWVGKHMICLFYAWNIGCIKSSLVLLPAHYCWMGSCQSHFYKDLRWALFMKQNLRLGISMGRWGQLVFSKILYILHFFWVKSFYVNESCLISNLLSKNEFKIWIHSVESEGSAHTIIAHSGFQIELQ